MAREDVQITYKQNNFIGISELNKLIFFRLSKDSLNNKTVERTGMQVCFRVTEIRDANAS